MPEQPTPCGHILWIATSESSAPPRAACRQAGWEVSHLDITQEDSAHVLTTDAARILHDFPADVTVVEAFAAPLLPFLQELERQGGRAACYLSVRSGALARTAALDFAVVWSASLEHTTALQSAGVDELWTLSGHADEFPRFASKLAQGPPRALSTRRRRLMQLRAAYQGGDVPAALALVEEVMELPAEGLDDETVFETATALAYAGHHDPAFALFERAYALAQHRLSVAGEPPPEAERRRFLITASLIGNNLGALHAAAGRPHDAKTLWEAGLAGEVANEAMQANLASLATDQPPLLQAWEGGYTPMGRPL